MNNNNNQQQQQFYSHFPLNVGQIQDENSQVNTTSRLKGAFNVQLQPTLQGARNGFGVQHTCQNFGSFGSHSSSAPFSTFSSYQPFGATTTPGIVATSSGTTSRGPLGDRTNTIHNNNSILQQSISKQKSANGSVVPTDSFSYFSSQQKVLNSSNSNPFNVTQQQQTQQVRQAQPVQQRQNSSRRSKKRTPVAKKKAPAFNIASSNQSLMEDILSDEDMIVTAQPSGVILANNDQEIDSYFDCQYTKEIFDHMRNTEVNHRPNSRYMEQVQHDINATMRGILVDWLVEVCGEFDLLPETLFLAVNITDRALGKFVIERKKLQMIGVTALFISSKYFEMQPPSVEEYVYITDNTYNKDDILRMESQILNLLGFDLTVVTIIDFLDRYLKAACANDLVSDLAHFLAELTLQDYSMIGYLPSAIAASCVVLALFSLNVPHWTEQLKRFTGYSGPELTNCIADLLALYQQLDSSSLTAVKDKYSLENRNRIAQCICFRQFDYTSLSV